MSHLSYTTPDGFGKASFNSHKYNQAVRVGDVLHIAGQGGWTQEAPSPIFEGIKEQIDQAFLNIDNLLKAAGGKGWEQVFRVNSYHIPLSDEAQDAMVAKFEKWMPNHKATRTCVEVVRLGGGPTMRVEIEGQAHVGN